MQLDFIIRNQSIRRTDKNYVVEKTKNYLTASFTFETDEWVAIAKTARFKSGVVVRDIVLDNTNICSVPWEVINNGKVEVSVFGGDLITTGIATFLVNTTLYNTEIGNVVPNAPTVDIYTQILNRLNALESGTISEEAIEDIITEYLTEHPLESLTTEEVETIVNEVLTNYTIGRHTHTIEDITDFPVITNGTNGIDGIDGIDGVSPVVTTERNIENTGYNITITDVNGTNTITVLDGVDGQNGVSDISAENKAKLENISDEFVVNIIYDSTAGDGDFTRCFRANHTATEILDAYYNQHKRLVGTYTDDPDLPTHDIYPLTPMHICNPPPYPEELGIPVYPHAEFSAWVYGQAMNFSIEDTAGDPIVQRNNFYYESKDNKVESMDSTNNHMQYPTAKATYLAIETAKFASYEFVEGESICGKYMGKTLYRYCYTKPTETTLGSNTDFDIGLDATNVDKVIAMGATGGNGNAIHGGKLNNRIVMNALGTMDVHYFGDTTFWVEYTKTE